MVPSRYLGSSLARMAPDIFEATATGLIAPTVGVTPMIHHVVEKARAEEV